MKLKKEKMYLLFMLPALVMYTIFLIYPMITSFYYSLTDWDGLSREINFIGFENFKYMLKDDGFIIAIKNTLIFVAMDVIIQNVMGLGFALLLQAKIRSRNLLRALFFIPVIMAPIVVSFIWTYIYNYENGVLNLIGQSLGFLKMDFIGNPQYAIYFVVISGIWQWFTYRMIIYVSGLQGISKDLYESANIDGAGKISTFFKITLPMLMPSISINVMLCTIGALKQFDIVFTMTNGGPGYATEVISTKIYREAFTNMSMGYGTAIGVVLFLVILLITMVQNKLFSSKEVLG